MNEEIFFRSIYEHMGVPIFVLLVNVDGDFVFGGLNPACEKATGLRNEDVVGKRAEEISGLPQEDAAALRANCQRCLETHEAIQCEEPFVGHTQGAWWLTRLAPVRDEAGKIVQIIGSSVDITDLKRAEDALRESERKYRDLIDGMNDTVWVIDFDTTILDVNNAAAKVLGYTREALLSAKMSDIDDNLTPEQIQDLARSMPSDKIQIFETWHKTKEGRRLPVEVSSSLVSYGGRTVILSIARDITERKRAEEALRQSEERYRMLFRRLPVGVFHYDTQLCISDCNDRFVAILQSSRERLEGLDMKTLRDQSVLSALRQAAEGKEGSYEGFYRATTSSAEIWISMRTAPLVDLQGQVKGGIGIVEDITERKQGEHALRRSENEKAILNQIASIFLTVPDEAMYGEVLAVVLQVMKSKFGIFGYVGEDGDLVIPSLTREIWSECQVPGKSVVFPADSWGTSLWGRAIREKEPFCSNGPFRTPEGHIHIDHFLTVPIVYGQKTIGLISVANKEGGYAKEDKDFLERIVSRVSPILNARLQRDAQERRRRAAEKNLMESEEKYRLLITNAGEAIFIVQDDAVKFPNPKALEMSGYSTEELASIPFIDLVHPSDKEAVLEGYSKLLEGKQPEPFPFRIIDKTGKERWVQLTTAPIIWEKRPGILCFLRDVTDEKKLEAQLMQAQKTEAMGRLAGGVAHDFNNMLTVIIGNTEMALMDVASSDPLYARLQNVDNAARRSADLTRQLLAFARKQTIAPKVLNLNDTVSGMLEMLRRLIGEDIDLAWRPWVELWPVKMDPSQIDQVLANLCVNARDAIAGVGKVTVETGNIVFDEDYCATHPDSIPGEYVFLGMSDDGCGMDQETQAHLFEPFFTTKGVGKGTGLGLATVYGIVKQNDGFINVYSEPGQGTTFKIYFPRHKAEPAGPLVETVAETPQGGAETILVVEDEEEILDVAESILEKLGYTVLIAKTPGEAIRLAEKDTGDIRLLITDVVMPEMNGHDLAERLSSIKPGLKCLYMSGYTADVIAHRGILEEGVYFIQKPFSMKDLAAKVREVLDQKSTDSHRE